MIMRPRDSRLTACCTCTLIGNAAWRDTQIVQWSGTPLSSNGCKWHTGSIIAISTRTMLAAIATLLDRTGDLGCMAYR